MSGGDLGEEHDRGRCGPCAECLTREAQAAAAKDQNQRAAQPDGDPFAAVPWSKARYGFVSALDALAKVTVRRYPGGGKRPDEDRRRDERAIVDACAEVCRAAGFPGFTLEDVERWVRATGKPDWRVEALSAARAERDAAEATTEQARRERDAAERGRDAARSDLDNVRKKLVRAQACHEIAAGKYATAEANLRDSRDRIARLEEDLAEYQKATASKTAAEAQETIVRLAGRIDVGQAALEQATSERDAALRSWEALREQLAAAEGTNYTAVDVLIRDGARAERSDDAAERDRAALRSRVADLEAEVTAWRAETNCDTPERAGRYLDGVVAERSGAPRPADEPDTLAAVRRDFAAELQRRDDRIDALEAKVSPEDGLSLAGIRVQCEELYAHIFREGGMGEQHADLLTRVDVLERKLAACESADPPRHAAVEPLFHGETCAKCEDAPAELCEVAALCEAAGSGLDAEDHGHVPATCRSCRGVGRLRETEDDGRRRASDAWRKCLDCNGAGHVSATTTGAGHDPGHHQAAGWGRYARRLRDGGDASADLIRLWIGESRSPHPTPAEQDALAGLERLAAQVDRCPGEEVAQQPAGDERADPTAATRVEMASRAALREEVAALCEAAGWPGCAAGIRSGNAARIYLQPRPAATTEATRNALAALDALAEAERPLAALWEHVAVLCERAGRPHAARELRRGRSVSDVLFMVRAAREWTREVRAAISALEKLDNASGSAHVAPGSIGPGTPEEQDRMRECPKNAIHPLQAAGFRCSCGYEGVS